MRTPKMIAAASALSALLLAGTSHAQLAGKQLLRSVDTVSQYYLLLPANTAVTITFSLRGGVAPFPVMIADAFAYPSEALLQEARSSADSTVAQLVFPAETADRPIVVVVRGAPGTAHPFDAVAEYHPSGGGDTTVPLESGYFTVGPSGPSIVAVPTGLPVTTHISTIEEQGGTDDTILMVLGADDRPIAYDDDYGVALMSWVHLFEECPAGSCSILVARAAVRAGKLVDGVPGPVPTDGIATLVWDAEGGHTGPDRDGDGMGDHMEMVLGTCDDPNNPVADTDGDGIKDCDEADVDGDGIPDLLELVGGADNPANEVTRKNRLKFHYYGANPLQRDLFVEADWDAGYQISATAAATIARVMSKGTKLHINVHMDNGLPALVDPTVSGDWGGAEQLATAGGYCDGLSPERATLFYHLRSTVGGAAQTIGRCSSSTEGGNALYFAHEAGHFFGLPDEGPEESGRANCKPQYLSQMNYGYAGVLELGGDPNATHGPYSPGTYTSMVLNPTSLDEYEGIGAANVPSLLATLIETYHGCTVYPNGSVDWNMDGAIAPQNSRVQAVLNYEAGKDCDLAPYHVRANKWFARATRPSVAVMDEGLVVVAPMRQQEPCVPRDLCVGPPSPPAPPVATGDLYVGVPDVSLCANPGHDKCATFNTKAAQLSQLYPAPSGSRSPTAAGDIIVYASDAGLLYYVKVAWTTTSGGLPQIDPAVQTTIRHMAGGSVSAAPTAIKDDASGRVLVFAPGAAPDGHYYLKRWEYDPATDQVLSPGNDEWWSSNDRVEVFSMDNGIGLTKGRLSTDPPGQTSIFAAIPVLTYDAGTGAPMPTIEIARLVRDGPYNVPGLPYPIYTSTWSRLDAGIWAEMGGHELTLRDAQGNLVGALPARLGLGFLPEGTEGRFYLTYRGQGGMGAAQFVTFTRGNTPWNGSGQRPTAALVFVRPTYFGNFYNDPVDGTSLVTFNGKIRGSAEVREADCELPGEGASCREDRPWTSFFPNADGIYNMDQKDFDDEGFIAANMSAVIHP